MLPKRRNEQIEVRISTKLVEDSRFSFKSVKKNAKSSFLGLLILIFLKIGDFVAISQHFFLSCSDSNETKLGF